MALIFETENFVIEAMDKPLVSRQDGGHITITPKVRVNDRSLLSPQLAIELMRLTMLVGEAMEVALNRRGIDVGRINYQDNGNWGVLSPEGPYLHYHLYGRAKSATVQKYGAACQFPFRDTGFYDDFEPLNQGDIDEINLQIARLEREPKFALESWHLPLQNPT